MVLDYHPSDYRERLRCKTNCSDEGNDVEVVITKDDGDIFFGLVPISAVIGWTSIAQARKPVEPVDPWFEKKNPNDGYDRLACCVIENGGDVATVFIPTSPTPTVLDVAADAVINNQQLSYSASCNQPEVPFVQP